MSRVQFMGSGYTKDLVEMVVMASFLGAQDLRASIMTDSLESVQDDQPGICP